MRGLGVLVEERRSVGVGALCQSISVCKGDEICTHILITLSS